MKLLFEHDYIIEQQISQEGKDVKEEKAINLFFLKLLWTSFKSEKLNYMTSFQIKSIVV